MHSNPTQPTNNKYGVLIVTFSALIGLNIITGLSYVAFTSLDDIQVPFSQLSNNALFINIFRTLIFPVLGILIASVGFYFGSRTSAPERHERSLASIDVMRMMAMLIPLHHKTFLRAGRLIVVIATQLLITLALLLLVFILEYMIKIIIRDSPITIFNTVPISYFFDAIDIMVVGTFVISTILATIQILRSPESK